eukprot:2006072-Pleurochrysis_carterae.AAC.1
MRASAGTGPAAGSISHSLRCTAGVVRGSSTVASAARLPASPVSDLSATSFEVAAAGSSPSAASVRAAVLAGAAALPAVPPRCVLRDAVTSRSAMRRSAASV